MNGRADVPYQTLDLPEPARSLFRKTRAALETHVSVYAARKGLLAMTGFLGTRADVLMDLAITFFVAAPFLMTYALRLAARGRYRAHRNLQAGLVVSGTVAVLLLEGSIQYGEAMAAYAQSAYYGTPLIRGLFSVHLWVAIPWFIGWCVLTGVSWRGYIPRAAGGLQFDTPALRGGYLRRVLVHLHHRCRHVRLVLRPLTAWLRAPCRESTTTRSPTGTTSRHAITTWMRI